MLHANYEVLRMAITIETLSIPYSEVFAESNVSPEAREACGLIPEFFARSIAEGADTLDKLGDAMQKFYGFNQTWDFGGSITAEGVYQSPHDDDSDLEPLGHWISNSVDRFDLYVYPYGITSIRHQRTGETKIARMD